MKARVVILALVGTALVAGAFLRLEDMSLMEFKADEGRVLVIVNRWAVRGIVPTSGGITSVGGRFAPLFSYLLSIPYALYGDPVWVTLCIALFNVLGLFLCYLMVRRFWGELVAVVAVLLFAVSPWAVLYSRKIWNPNVCPPFTIFFIYSLLSILVDKKTGYVFPLILSWLILVQLHPVYLVLGIVPAVAFVLYRPPWRWFHLAAGLLLGLIPLVAMARFWLGRHDLLEEIGALFSSGGRGEAVPLARSLLQAWKIPFVMNLSSLKLDNVLGDAAWSSLVRGPFSVGLNLAEHVLLVVGLLLVVRGVLAGGRRHDPRGLVLVLWFLVPSVVFGFARTALAPHYFSVLYPSQFILIGLAFEWLWAPSPRAGARRGLLLRRGLLILLICGMAVSQTLFMYRFYRVIERDGGTSGDYGTAYIHKQRAVTFMVKRSLGRPFSISDEFDSDYFPVGEYRYLVLKQVKMAWPASGDIDRYVIWDPYRKESRGEYPDEVPRGWTEVARQGPLRVYWKPAASRSGK